MEAISIVNAAFEEIECIKVADLSAEHMRLWKKGSWYPRVVLKELLACTYGGTAHDFYLVASKSGFRVTVKGRNFGMVKIEI